MIYLINHGCNGYMGKVLTRMAENDSQVQIIAGVDLLNPENVKYPVFSSLADLKGAKLLGKEDADSIVLVDFSTAKAVDGVLDFCEETKIPAVICTTGLSEEQIDRLHTLSESCAVVKSANMSLGINLLMKVMREVSATLKGAGFDPEILEKHHNRKLDAPSGTAISIADAINEGVEEKYSYNFNRSDVRKKREKEEIGFASIRGGSIVGEHDVIWAGEDEIIEFSHTALSRDIFAKGALTAAKFLAGKEPGLYDMSDVIG